MGAGQSKQPTKPTTGVGSAAESSLSSAAVQHTNAAPSTATDSSSSPTPNAETTGGGGCPMKNADGSYRVMPGFASLFGKLSGHPPVDASKINTTSASGAATSTANANGASSTDTQSTATASAAAPSSGGCPVKHDSPSSRSWNILRRGGSGPGSDNLNNSDSACPVKNTGTAGGQQQQQYDVYSRPLPMDPTNNMPVVNPTTVARNSLPSPGQSRALPTERVSSSIPKGSAGTESSNTTWTYPSPQMFYNALARKGKLDEETKEEDMISVVAIHNCMNEGTWGRVLQWENVLNKPNNDKNDGEEESISVSGSSNGPSLTKFMGRPTDLSPKAAFKHYLFNHPLPFDRHDWTVTRSNSDGSTSDVRYVIDYYHDDAAANEEDGSGLPSMNEGIGRGGRIQSLLVDVRPAADSVSDIWGRMVTMPLARRGCRSILECVMSKGNGYARERSDFEPLPLKPHESLQSSLSESQEVWENIQKDAAMKKGVGAKDEACASNSLEGEEKKVESVVVAADSGRKSIDQPVPTADAEEENITKSDAKQFATSFANILSSCKESKADLQNCTSDEECKRAFLGMTVCAGQFMCQLQHSSLMASLENMETAAAGTDKEEMAEAKVNMAFEVLGECVSNYDQSASVAKRQYPEVFDEVLKNAK